MDIKMLIKKQGGIELFRKYLQGGALFTAIGEFILLGKSRSALEILRLSTQFKIKQKLRKKYMKTLVRFDETFETGLTQKSCNKVWFCWFQGIENAPELVKNCLKSMHDNLSNREIILLTYDNILNYIDFPDYIIKKWKEGKITNTHMTDLLRLELLIKYGGMWVDATVLCTRKENEIPPYFFDSDLFLYQLLKPGRDGHSTYISSWLISAKTNNKLLMATRYLCYEYWKKNDKMVDYFLLHDFLSIVLEYYQEDWKMITPLDNATPHILLLRLFDSYDKEMWENIKKQTPFHKLSYKFSVDQINKEDTYYDVIIRKGKI